MFNLKEYAKDKGIGFYFTAAIALLTLITAIVYAAGFAGTDDMSWAAFALLLVGLAGSVALIAFKQYFWAPIVQAVFCFLALLMFIYGIYYYVSVVMTGIDATAFSAQFWVSTILFALLFVLSVANIFLSQTKDGENA